MALAIAGDLSLAVLAGLGGSPVAIAPLLVASVVATTLSAERVWFWQRVRRQERPALRAALDLYRRGQRPRALAKLRRDRHLPLARIALAALELEDPDPDSFRLAIATAVQAELPRLRRFDTALQTVVAIAPLLGLLGTILGLIDAFADLDLGGSGTDASGVTLGIGQALISTAAGLMVGLVALLCANGFRACYRQQMAQIGEIGRQLELIYRQHYRSLGPSESPG